MILGVHNMVDAVSHYTKEHVTNDGALWILGLDGILLIPIIFAAFFYPLAMLIGLGALLALVVVYLGYLALVRALQAHRSELGH